MVKKTLRFFNKESLLGLNMHKHAFLIHICLFNFILLSMAEGREITHCVLCEELPE